jgi:hypothetical protein
MAELKKYPSDDARVYSGSAGTNYGSDTTVVIRKGSTTSFYDMGYLKWDLSSAPPVGSINTVKFYIYVTEIVSGLINDVETYLVAAPWGESTITYTNKPAVTGSNLATYDLTSVGAKSNDITSTVIDWMNGDTNNYGLRLFPATNHGYRGDEYVRIGSTENATESYRPYLLFDYGKGGGILNWFFIKEALDKGKKYFKNRGLWLPESKPLTI